MRTRKNRSCSYTQGVDNHGFYVHTVGDIISTELEFQPNTNKKNTNTMGYKQRQLEIREQNFSLIASAIQDELQVEFNRQHDAAIKAKRDENQALPEYKELLDIDRNIYRLKVEQAGLGSFQAKRREEINKEIVVLEDRAYELAKDLLVSRYRLYNTFWEPEEFLKKNIREIIAEVVEIDTGNINRTKITNDEVRARLSMMDWEKLSYDEVKDQIRKSVLNTADDI